jgi:hypothetical protein
MALVHAEAFRKEDAKASRLKNTFIAYLNPDR